MCLLKKHLCIAAIILSVNLIACRPEQNSTQTGLLKVKITDSLTASALTARVYIQQGDSVYLTDENCITLDIPWLEAVTGHRGRHFTTKTDSFQIALPPGQTSLKIEHGKDYRPWQRNIRVEAGETILIDCKLQRWINMQERGWYAADHHVHRNIEELPYLLQAEDVNLALLQSNWNANPQFLQQADSILPETNQQGVLKVSENKLVSVISQEIEGKHGAVMFHLINKADYPLPHLNEKDKLMRYFTLCRMTKKFRGYTEIDKPIYKNSHVLSLLNSIDFMGLINNHNLHRNYIPETAHNLNRSLLSSRYTDDQYGYSLFVYDLYYHYLNIGLRLIPTAGSASYPIPNPFGYNRVYVKVNPPFTVRRYFYALKAGRCFVSNGPMLILSANEYLCGDTISLKDSSLIVNTRLYYHRPLSTVELIYNGKVVKTHNKLTMSNDSLYLTDTIAINESGWLAARCFDEADKQSLRLAHSAPLFVCWRSEAFLPKAESISVFRHITNGLMHQTYFEDNSMERLDLMAVYQNIINILDNLHNR